MQGKHVDQLYAVQTREKSFNVYCKGLKKESITCTCVVILNIVKKNKYCKSV